MDDGMVYNSKTKWLIKPENLPFRIDGGKMRKKLPFEEGIDFHKMKNGYKFVMVDFCESIRKHKKTLHIHLLKFDTFDYTSRKYDSIKINRGWFKFEYGYKEGSAYQLMCVINHEFPNSIRVLKIKELRQDGKA